MASKDGKDKAQGGVEAVDRALRVVGCFGEGDAALTLTEIAQRTGYYMSTILRLAASLEKAGFLVRRSDKGFALGSEVMRLGALYQRSFRIEEHVRPVLKRVLQATGESASFFRREGDGRLCLFREDSLHGIRDHVHEGEVLPLDKGAPGRVLTSFDETAARSPEEMARAFAALPFVSLGERDAEMAAIAVPVFSGRDGLVGALNVSGPVTRFTAAKVAEMRPLLLEAGRRLSEDLGGGHCWRGR